MADTIWKGTFTHKGHTFNVKHVTDPHHGPPWKEYDGHGVITEYLSDTQADSDPDMELFRELDHAGQWHYDWSASLAKAHTEQWSLAPEKAIGLTPEQITEAAVEADYQFIRGWCVDEWYYIGVVVSLDGTDIERSLWGIESNADDYLKEVARELADDVLTEAPAELDAEIARLQALRGSL